MIFQLGGHWKDSERTQRPNSTFFNHQHTAQNVEDFCMWKEMWMTLILIHLEAAFLMDNSYFLRVRKFISPEWEVAIGHVATEYICLLVICFLLWFTLLFENVITVLIFFLIYVHASTMTDVWKWNLIHLMVHLWKEARCTWTFTRLFYEGKISSDKYHHGKLWGKMLLLRLARKGGFEGQLSHWLVLQLRF